MIEVLYLYCTPDSYMCNKSVILAVLAGSLEVDLETKLECAILRLKGIMHVWTVNVIPSRIIFVVNEYE